MNNLLVLRTRNKLMANIMWFISILFITFASISGVNKKSLFAIAPVLVILSIIITILVYKRIVEDNIMYIASLSLCLVHFLFILLFHDLDGFLIGFLVMIIISLYQQRKSIILTALLVLSSIIYGYFSGGEKMFASFHDPVGLAIVIFVFIIATALMCTQSKSTEKIRQNVEVQKDEMENSKITMEKVLDKLKISIENLMTFSKDLQNNINVTGRISEDLLTAFNEISVNVESQSTLISNINMEVNNETECIKSVVKESSHMHSLSDNTFSISEDCNSHVVYLSNEMQKVSSSVNGAVSSMINLNSQANHIESILGTLNAISKQINLLALNAAIEASRAGEHGKGFSVVAEEIRNLAEQSHQSNMQISNILVDIQSKIDEVSTQINLIESSASTSNTSIGTVNYAFNSINSNSKTVVSKAEQIDEMTLKIQMSSSQILDNVTMVSSSAQETSASVQEVLAGINEQNVRIENIVKSFETLENLISDLRNVETK